jgi:hypothetical protein
VCWRRAGWCRGPSSTRARPRSRTSGRTITSTDLAHELKERWLIRALARAGIDRNRWRPAKGVDYNRATVEAVYRYYGDLCLAHPELRWAGMASLIGPAFYAGFQDVALLRLVARDLGFYETTFLTMQKKIFEDQATMHEAFLGGGVDAITELHDARIVDSATLEAWRQIDAGLLEPGNRTLLLREQRDIIDRFYLGMLNRPGGGLFTYLLTLAGAPSVPGGKGYPERYPLTLPLGPVSLRTPLANGNIAVFANRWQLIDEDTLPAYVRFVRDHLDDARTLMGTPVARRAIPFRVLARAGLILRAAITRWGIVAERPTKPLAAAETEATTIDLTDPPHSRVWMNPGRRPFDLTVRLPQGRDFHARPALAVMLDDHLVVQLPEAGLDATAARLAEWGAPEDEIARWRRGAERRPATDRDYSTHVFGAGDVELEVSHHVREGVFTLAYHAGGPRPH